ncbi:MAG: membrane-bound lytic murein transglycosylase MltF, partial [Pseudomonadota bacterium]
MNHYQDHSFTDSLRVFRGRLPLRMLLVVVVLLLLTSGRHNLTELEQIQERGRLMLLTINGATTYYLGPEGEAGFEYDLARQFADYLGVPLEVITRPSVGDLLPTLRSGHGDFIAANLSQTHERQRRIRFGPVYDEVKPMLVYRRGARRPREPEDLLEGRLAVMGGTSYDRFLSEWSEDFGLQWQIRSGDSIEDLLEAVSNEEIDYTIIDSNILDLNRRFFPAIRIGFEIDRTERLAWATELSDDDTLAQKMREFFVQPDHEVRMADLRARYYGHVERYEAVGTFHFMEQMRERLPIYRPLFEETAEAEDLDWRLLAAIGYQESHWDPDAVSPTGVRGLMMLTQRTARHIGIEDRLDPAQSIDGGARYLNSLIERLPERIQHPDRLWLALAAYNIGFGHLEDARRLTQRYGGDPDRWVDVREHLPLLTQERYFTET